jgi:hypothetical protein
VAVWLDSFKLRVCFARSDGTILESRKWEHVKLAKALMYTCWQMYETTATGLSAEYMEFKGGMTFGKVRCVSSFQAEPLPTQTYHMNTHTRQSLTFCVQKS